MAQTRRGEYGYDAPYALIGFAIAGIVAATGAVVVWRNTGAGVTPPLIIAVFFWLNAASFLYTTRRGKFEQWERILDELHLRGDERVLDVGCGRGAVLTAVASRLRTGRVTGVDRWITRDQSGNAQEVTLRNAALEGAADRIDVGTGDMRALPFPDGTFDLVARMSVPAREPPRRAHRGVGRTTRPAGRSRSRHARRPRIHRSAEGQGVRRLERSWRRPSAGTAPEVVPRDPRQGQDVRLSVSDASAGRGDRSRVLSWRIASSTRSARSRSWWRARIVFCDC
jgi:arsenite methyltransferase